MHISATQLAEAYLPYGRRAGWLCMLRAYFDDSGTHASAPVVVIGGLLGLSDDWRAVEAQWIEKLRDPIPESNKPKLDAFHLSACVARRDEFENYNETESSHLRQEFRRIILSSNLRYLAVVVSRPDWDELVVPPYRNFMGTAEQSCFIGFLNKSLDILKEINADGLQIAFIYDVGRKTKKFDDIIRLAENKQFRPSIASIGWAKVKDTPALQAADTIATENYWAAQKWLKTGSIKNASIHFHRLHNGMAGDGLILDREAIKQELSRRGPDGKPV